MTSSARSVHIGKGGNEDDHGKAQTRRAQGDRAFAGNPAYIDPVYDIIEQVDDLGGQHRQGGPQDIPENTAFGKMDLSHDAIILSAEKSIAHFAGSARYGFDPAAVRFYWNRGGSG